MLLSLIKTKLLKMSFLTNSLNLLILLNASVSLFVPSSSLVAPDRFEAPKLDKSKAKKRFKTYKRDNNSKYCSKCWAIFLYHTTSLTTKFPMTTVARKKGTHTLEATHMQSHIDSIHSPHRTRKTIIKLCMKSVKFHLGIVFPGNLSILSRKRGDEMEGSS